MKWPGFFILTLTLIAFSGNGHAKTNFVGHGTIVHACVKINADRPKGKQFQASVCTYNESTGSVETTLGGEYGSGDAAMKAAKKLAKKTAKMENKSARKLARELNKEERNNLWTKFKGLFKKNTKSSFMAFPDGSGDDRSGGPMSMPDPHGGGDLVIFSN